MGSTEDDATTTKKMIYTFSLIGVSMLGLYLLAKSAIGG